MTISFSFENPMTPEILAAVNELNRLAKGEGGIRTAVAPPAQTQTATAPAQPARPQDRQPQPAPAGTERLLTEADVRAAMDEAKARIWGANHATDPAMTKEAKAPLVEAFRAIARTYGAEKPSLLPSHTARANFIRHISTLTLDPDGNIVEGDLPF